MALNLTRTTAKVTNISELATKPNATDGLTDATFKALFDKFGADIKIYLNSTLLPEIETAVNAKPDSTNLYTKTEVDTLINAKQKAITSGTADPTGGADGDIYIQYV